MDIMRSGHLVPIILMDMAMAVMCGKDIQTPMFTQVAEAYHVEGLVNPEVFMLHPHLNYGKNIYCAPQQLATNG
jgi:hypothetical protein